MRPLAITGLGTVTGHGAGREAFVRALTTTSSAHESKLVAAEFPGARVVENSDFDAAAFLGDKGLRNFDRLTKFMTVAAKLALQDAGVKEDGAFVGSLGPDQIGILSATAYGSLEAITELNLVAEKEDPRYINPARFPNTVINAAAGYVSIWEDLRAPNVTIVDGNCGALDAVLSAQTHLSRKRAQAFLVGGGEVISETLYRALNKLGIVAELDSVCAPGDEHSAGVHIGEAAAYALVERESAARARGAKIEALITGYGSAFEAPSSDAELTHASPDAVARAVRTALVDAQIDPSQVQLVLSSCSGLWRFDQAELQGISQVFGQDIAIAAPKSLFGETFGASGAVGLALASTLLRGDHPVRLLRGERPPTLDTIVITTMGYYGNVSAVVVTRAIG